MSVLIWLAYVMLLYFTNLVVLLHANFISSQFFESENKQPGGERAPGQDEENDSETNGEECRNFRSDHNLVVERKSSRFYRSRFRNDNNHINKWKPARSYSFRFKSYHNLMSKWKSVRYYWNRFVSCNMPSFHGKNCGRVTKGKGHLKQLENKSLINWYDIGDLKLYSSDLLGMNWRSLFHSENTVYPVFGNVNTPGSEHGHTDLTEKSMRDMAVRFKSFKGYPNSESVNYLRLSRYGFYYTGVRDRVRCYSCGCEHEGWKKEDNPATIHSFLAPNCELVQVQEDGNISMSTISYASNASISNGWSRNVDCTERVEQSEYHRPCTETACQISKSYDKSPSNGAMPLPQNNNITSIECTGMIVERPKYPIYAVMSVRVSSYSGWPTYLSQTPLQMATAGLFYVGFGDNVRCFFCGGGLRNWETNDDPWAEHATWFPECQFVRQARGDEFLHTHENKKVTEEYQLTRSNGSATYDNFDVPMTSAVCSIKEMGYSHGAIQTALKRLGPSKGGSSHRITAEELLNVLFEMEEPEATVACVGDIGASASNGAVSSMEEKGITSLLVRQMQDTSISLDDTTSLIQENARLKQETLCKVCLQDEATITLLPCGHLACCQGCKSLCRGCPVCHRRIEKTIRTFRV